MKGPTGVGKTEIARRLAKLVKAPFIKVEATKYTEVGYVGRDVESMIRDLAEVVVRMVKEERFAEIAVKENIIQAYSDKLNHSYQNGYNLINIKVHKSFLNTRLNVVKK